MKSPLILFYLFILFYYFRNKLMKVILSKDNLYNEMNLFVTPYHQNKKLKNFSSFGINHPFNKSLID
jgi:hypothetical protein